MPPIEDVDEAERRSMYYRHPVDVYDARALRPVPSIELHGFTLLEHDTQCNDLHDRVKIKSTLYIEYARILKHLTGCAQVKVTQHQYRNGYGGLPTDHPRAAKPTPNGSEGVYGGIHSDVTPYSEPGWGPQVDERHFQVFNFWQSTRPEGIIQVMPLSLCDMRSVEPDDMIYVDSWNQTKHPRKLLSYRLAYNANQKWYYYPNMQSNELLIFKQYDSFQEAPNLRCVYHGAIDLPNTPPDAPLRETIEVRLLAIFEKETDKLKRVRRFQSQIPKLHPDGEESSWELRYP